MQALHFQRTPCSALSATGEWPSLWGKRKDEIERRGWRRIKREAMSVGTESRRDGDGEDGERNAERKWSSSGRGEGVNRRRGEGGFSGKPSWAAEKPG